SDNVTWYFARGPRQATSLDGSFATGDPADRRIFNWTAIFDEVDDFELNTRGVSGGVGAIVGQVPDPATGLPQVSTADRIDIAPACAGAATNTPCSGGATNGNGNGNLNGSARQASDPANPQGLNPAGKLPDWQLIEAYMQSIRSPRAATGLDAAKVAAGALLF